MERWRKEEAAQQRKQGSAALQGGLVTKGTKASSTFHVRSLLSEAFPPARVSSLHVLSINLFPSRPFSILAVPLLVQASLSLPQLSLPA